MIDRWYITAAAVRQWQDLCEHYGGSRPSFDDAAVSLEETAAEARLKKDEGHRQIYRVKATLGGRRHRLELTVSTADRDEGPLPQLVRVRRTGGSRTGTGRSR